MARPDPQDALMKRLTEALQARGLPVDSVLEAILEAADPPTVGTQTPTD